MTKAVLRPASCRDGDIFVEIESQNGRLSFTGVIGPDSYGNSTGSCGQIDMGFAHRDPADNDRRYSKLITPNELKFAPGWNAELWLDLLAVWKRWHLNDMRPWCEHQREWDTQAELEIQELTWGDSYHQMRRDAEVGKLSSEAYAVWPAIVEAVERATRYSAPKHPDLWDSDTQELLETGYLKIGKTEIKAAGWVHPGEHPQGLLAKPCEVCGYKYGSAWRYEPVPAEVIDFINSLPNPDKNLPGKWAK